MAVLLIKDGSGSSKYIQVDGAGTSDDPYRLKGTNSAAVLTALQAIQAATEAFDGGGGGGDATAANQTAGNTILSAIDGHVDGLETTVAATNTKLDTVHTDLGTLLTTGAPITGEVLEAGGVGGLGWFSSIRKKLADTLGTTTDAAATGNGSVIGILKQVRVLLSAALAVTPTAGELHLGEVSGSSDVIDLLATLDNSGVYAAGDVLFDTQSLPGSTRTNAGIVVLESLTVLDEDDQGAALDIYFFDTNVSLGSENSVPSITDANARGYLGHVSVAASDYKDLGGCKVATIKGIGLELKAASGVTAFNVAGVTQGTPTHTASGLRFKFGFLRN